MTQSTTEKETNSNQKAFRVTFEMYGKRMATTVFGATIKTPQDAENHVKSKLKFIKTEPVQIPDIQKEVDSAKESLAEMEKTLHEATEKLSEATDKMFNKIDNALGKGFRKVDSIFDTMNDMWKSSSFSVTKEVKEDETGTKTNPENKEPVEKS